MKRILLTLSYKGTNYCGFQIQNNGISIQQVLENALEKLFLKPIKVYASGRTDAGVHALKQKVHFDCEISFSIERLSMAINNFLPNDIRVLDAIEVPQDFHARFSAKRKTYMYVFTKGQIVSPILYDLVSKLDFNVNIQTMQKESLKLLGEHDFTAFCASNSGAKDFVKTIYDITIEEKSNYLIFKICGSGFLYNMVRIIVGTFIDIGRGKLPTDVIDKMLESGDRRIGGMTADAKGLYLYDVNYL